MSAQVSIVLADGKATPVSHTFEPRGAKNKDGKDIAIWRDQSSGIAVGFATLTEHHSVPNSNGVEKFRYVIDVPALEQAASGGTFVPAPTKAFSDVVVIEIFAHERSSEDRLKDLVAYAKNFTSGAYFANAVTKRDAAW